MSGTDQCFVVIGTIGRDGTAIIFESFLAADLPHTEEPSDRTHTLAFVDGGGNTLEESPLHVPFDTEDLPITLPETTFSVVRPFPEETASVEIRREGEVLAALTRSAAPPTVANVKVIPSVNFEVDKQINVEWSGADGDGTGLTYSVSYSIDQGKSFRPIESGLKENQLTISTDGLGGSKNALLKVTASNGFETSEAVSDPFVLPTNAPVATILSPERISFAPDEAIVLRGAAFDYQDGVLSDESLEWFLVKGQEAHLIGSGREPVTKPLPIGEHTIRLVATNRAGEQGTEERLVRIQEATPVSSLLQVAQVGTPDIYYIFSREGAVTPTDTVANMTIPNTTDNGSLQSRDLPQGEETTPGSGLFAYLYRISLSDVVGDPVADGLAAFSFEFGSVEPMNYDNNPSDTKAHVFVITRGGLGNVAPSAVEQEGNIVTFHFSPAIRVGKSVGEGETSFFFGLASRYAPRDVVATVRDQAGRDYSVNARAPGFPR